MTDKEPIGLIRNELELNMEAPTARVWMPSPAKSMPGGSRISISPRRPRRVVLEAELGGRLFEQSEDGSGLIWYTVAALSPGKSISLSGALVPPYAGPGLATLHLALEPSDSGTLFKLSETVFGHIGENLQASLREGWGTLFEQGLKAFVESRSPASP